MIWWKAENRTRISKIFLVMWLNMSSCPGQKTDQTIKKALELLEVKYGRSRIKRIKELVDDLLKFREDQYEDDGELLLAMKDIRRRETELEITRDEWLVIWMLVWIKKRKKVDPHKIQTLRDVVRKGEEKVVENFENVFKEVRIERKRQKASVVNYTESSSTLSSSKDTKETLYMGTSIKARRRYQRSRSDRRRS